MPEKCILEAFGTGVAARQVTVKKAFTNGRITIDSHSGFMDVKSFESAKGLNFVETPNKSRIYKTVPNSLRNKECKSLSLKRRLTH